VPGAQYTWLARQAFDPHYEIQPHFSNGASSFFSESRISLSGEKLAALWAGGKRQHMPHEECRYLSPLQLGFLNANSGKYW